MAMPPLLNQKTLGQSMGGQALIMAAFPADLEILWCLFSPGLQFQHSLMNAIPTQSNSETWVSTTVITTPSWELKTAASLRQAMLVTLAPFQKQSEVDAYSRKGAPQLY